MAPSTGSTGTDTNTEWQNNLPRILVVQTIFTFLALLAVGLRLYVRIKLIKNTGADDWTMSIAALCALGGWILWAFEGTHGLGHSDAWFAEGNGDATKVSQGSFWQVIIDSALGIAMLKISIALNLLRLSPARWYVYCLWASIVIVAAYCFMGAMAFFLYCRPMSAFWTHSPGSECYPIQLFVTFGLVNTAFNIFTDVFFATIPIPIIWTLQMRRRVRIYLIGILSLGYLAVVFGVLNAIYQIAFTKITDQYLNDWILFWATLQFTTGIIAACIPSLKPLVSSVLKLSEYSNSRSQGPHGSHYRSQRAATGTRGSIHTMGGVGGNHMWSIHRGDQYALQELGSRGSGDGSNSDEVRLTRNGDYNVTAAYTQNFSASDETSPGHANNQGSKSGIIKTTEVIVH